MNLGAASAGVAASGLIQHQTDATEQRLTGLADPAPRRVYLVDAVVMSRNALTTFKTKMALTGVVADTGDRDTEISSRTQSFARRDVPLHMPTDMSIRANNRVSFVDNKHRRGPPACLAPLYSKPAPALPTRLLGCDLPPRVLHGERHDPAGRGDAANRLDRNPLRPVRPAWASLDGAAHGGAVGNRGATPKLEIGLGA